MEREPFDSDALVSAGYEAGVLELEFVDGTVYRYFDVPELVFRQLLRADSKGTFFLERIRDRYDFALV